MTEQEVIDLMNRSRSEAEWNTHCDQVTKACGGYPPYWFQAIVLSGMAERLAARWIREWTVSIMARDLRSGIVQAVNEYHIREDDTSLVTDALRHEMAVICRRAMKDMEQLLLKNRTAIVGVDSK